MNEKLERALKAKPEEEVTALYNSDGPSALTKDKKYKILGVTPLHTRDAEGKEKSVVNVFFAIRDDLDKVAHPSHIMFKEYS